MTELDWQKSLAECELFSGLTEQEMNQFHAMGYGKISVYRAATRLKEDEKKQIIYVIKGTIRIQRSWKDKEVLFVDRAGAGEYLGLDWKMPSAIKKLYKYETESDTMFYRIDPECFFNEDRVGKELFQKLTINYNRLLRKTLHSVYKKREILLTDSIRSKLLLYLGEQQELAGSNEFYIPYTRDQLAEYLYTNRTALSREIGRMMRDGLIQTKGKYFLIKY